MSRNKGYQNLKRCMKNNLYYNTMITAMEETGEEIQITDNPKYRELLLNKNLERAKAIQRLDLEKKDKN